MLIQYLPVSVLEVHRIVVCWETSRVLVYVVAFLMNDEHWWIHVGRNPHLSLYCVTACYATIKGRTYSIYVQNFSGSKCIDGCHKIEIGHMILTSPTLRCHSSIDLPSFTRHRIIETVQTLKRGLVTNQWSPSNHKYENSLAHRTYQSRLYWSYTVS